MSSQEYTPPLNLSHDTERLDIHNWADDVDDSTWQLIAQGLQADAEKHDLASLKPPTDTVEPIDSLLTPVALNPTPRRLADYRANHMSNVREEETPHPEYTPWWDKGGFHTVARKFRQPIFREIAPDEEFVVGQGKRSIQVFNFGEPLSKERQYDLECFVDIATQFMGDRAYDFIADVIIGEFAPEQQDLEKHKDGYAGYALPGRGVVMINSAILPDNAPVDKNVAGSLFLQTLLHEFGGHLVHGNVKKDHQARADLEQFAKAVGWDIRGMEADDHDWSTKNADNGSYAPHVLDPDLPELSPPGGSPSEYGSLNPMETFAETSKYMMIGSKVLELTPEISDAWLDTLQKRLLKPGETMASRPIATSLEREPISTARYTGEAIRYPWQEPSVH